MRVKGSERESGTVEERLLVGVAVRGPDGVSVDEWVDCIVAVWTPEGDWVPMVVLVVVTTSPERVRWSDVECVRRADTVSVDRPVSDRETNKLNVTERVSVKDAVRVSACEGVVVETAEAVPDVARECVSGCDVDIVGVAVVSLQKRPRKFGAQVQPQ